MGFATEFRRVVKCKCTSATLLSGSSFRSVCDSSCWCLSGALLRLMLQRYTWLLICWHKSVRTLMQWGQTYSSCQEQWIVKPRLSIPFVCLKKNSSRNRRGHSPEDLFSFSKEYWVISSLAAKTKGTARPNKCVSQSKVYFLGCFLGNKS